VSALVTVVAASRGFFVESQARASRNQHGRRGYRAPISLEDQCPLALGLRRDGFE
jgi:hypothetical protein